MKKLGEFIRRRMAELRLTDRDVADASKGYVTYGTVNGIANAKNNDLRLSTIYGIALGLQVPKEHLIAIAFDDDPHERNLLSKTEQTLIYYFRHLPFDAQAFFLQSMQSLCAQESSVIDIPLDELISADSIHDSHGPALYKAPTKKGGKQ